MSFGGDPDFAKSLINRDQPGTEIGLLRNISILAGLVLIAIIAFVVRLIF